MNRYVRHIVYVKHWIVILQDRTHDVCKNLRTQSQSLIRQADVVGRLKIYGCPFFVNPLFSATAQRTPVKSIPEVRT